MRRALNRIAKWIVRRCLDLIAKVRGILGLSDKKMKLLVQPTDGITPLIQGIEKAKKSIQIVIFRFDRTDIERALEKAVARGVSVHETGLKEWKARIQSEFAGGPILA